MLTIERFEMTRVVIQYREGNTFKVPRYMIPPDAKKGDVINIEITIDHEKSEKRGKQFSEMPKEYIRHEKKKNKILGYLLHKVIVNSQIKPEPLEVANDLGYTKWDDGIWDTGVKKNEDGTWNVYWKSENAPRLKLKQNNG